VTCLLKSHTFRRLNGFAVLNGYKIDRHREETTVGLFAQNIYAAGESFLANPAKNQFIPSWKGVKSALPDFADRLKEAVELDNA
jgi:glucosyl-3-phosphoglycerate synthase